MFVRPLADMIVGVGVVCWCLGGCALGAVAGEATSLSVQESQALERLVAAYRDVLLRIDGQDLVWRDGTRMPVSDGVADKTFEQRLASSDILDMLRLSYVRGPLGSPPSMNYDPGRMRHQGFFKKLYGDCRKGGVAGDLVEIVWLPSSSARRLKVTKRFGVADRLRAVSMELDQLPPKYTSFLDPPGGTFNCRVIAGTSRMSAHGFGIAIDINVKRSHYWRWSKPDDVGKFRYTNEIPWRIVEVFEKHGFIWGGKWYHFDTMHFEYRPELIMPVPLRTPGAGAGVGVTP